MLCTWRSESHLLVLNSCTSNANNQNSDVPFVQDSMPIVQRFLCFVYFDARRRRQFGIFLLFSSQAWWRARKPHSNPYCSYRAHTPLRKARHMVSILHVTLSRKNKKQREINMRFGALFLNTSNVCVLWNSALRDSVLSAEGVFNHF